MKLIVGLGNPGEEYQLTPHNIGFLAIDRIAAGFAVEVRNRQARALTGRCLIGSEPVMLVKPQTYMNLSGESVYELLEKNDLEAERDLVVIQDELDFALGTLKLQRRRSSAGHNGIESIIGSIGTNDFLRIRVGVAPERRISDGKNYLLSPFRKDELKRVDPVLDEVAEAVKAVVLQGPAHAMNFFNRKPEPENSENRDSKKEQPRPSAADGDNQ